MAETITAKIPYTVPTDEKLVNESFGPKNIHGRRTGTVELKQMEIRNGRLLANRLSLEEQGLVFVQHKTKVTDFFDEEQVKAVYYPEIEELIKRESGASRVVIFDHALRSGNEAEREQKLIRNPVLQAHNDYTEWSGPNRLREILPDEAEKLLTRRFAIIQVWRAINRPIQANPLAMADAKSVAFDDWMVAERRYPHRVGQTYRLKYNPNHRWIYFPEMRPDEAIVFKVYDSEKDGRARFTAHTAFDDPNTQAGAPARQSIEMRAFAFFDS
ncbi:MAG TPA: CmcJ/NvfI family oxidoreductase [Terriglobales bacterium]|nr:CmcJ/NvfI family oxidoreductase [Terriglobales bacterium]